jgi:NAD-dependent SIR2 family protein deacetylase
MNLIDKYLGEEKKCPEGEQFCPIKKKCVPIGTGRKEMSEAKGSSTQMECMECGHKFKKKIGKKTVEVKCPKCGGYDTDVA